MKNTLPTASYLSRVTRPDSPVGFCRLALLVALLLAQTACESIITSAPLTATATRALDAPTEPSVLVPFPTSTPALATVVAPTPLRSGSEGTPTRVAPVPLVQMLAPQASAPIGVHQTFYAVAYAASENGIARVELTDEGTPVQVATAPIPAPPVFAAILPWTPTQIGAHTLRVVAFDVNNRSSVPDQVTVNVVANARKPTSIIVYPVGTPQVDFGSLLTIAGVATDEVGVTRLDLFVDNQLYTYITAQDPTGQTPFPFSFVWHALVPGTHTFFVRARDGQGQTTDSAALKVLVVNNRSPVLSLAVERTRALANEPITITVRALDASGVARVELRSGKELLGTFSSDSPTRQTALTAQVIWQNANPGDYALVARAINAYGNIKEVTQTITLLRPEQSTLTPAPTFTPTRTRTPRATPTARMQPPPPPTAELIQPTDHFASLSPLRIAFSGKGNAELERIELWGYASGQAQPQIICTIDARATTQKAGQCEWSPPTAGVISLFAQAVDIYEQFGRSPTISGYIGAPVLPTPTPTLPSLAGRWSAATTTGPLAVTFRLVGAAWRGDFTMAGVEATGRITTSALKGDRLTFSVDFAPAETSPLATITIAPTAVAPALDFDCVVDSAISTLTCTFRDTRGRVANAQFRREAK